MVEPILAQLDYLLFAAGAVLLFGLLHFLFWKGRGGAAAIVWVLVLGVLAGGWFLTEEWGGWVFQQMRQTAEGNTPAFAQDLGLMGHQEITPETSPDDPRYLGIIAAEKRWLAANPSIKDIYTFRKLGDGRIALLVDSETDYDHNGRFEGEREQRAPIGKTYAGGLMAVIDSVLAGQPVLLDKPFTDPWGTRVSAAAPIRNLKGEVEAAVGVDFDTAMWMASEKRARLIAIGGLGALLLAIAAGSGLLVRGAARTGTQMQPPEQEEMQLEKQKLENLVNSIDGVVWEADTRTLQFAFVSQQCEGLLGFPRNEWTTVREFWKARLHAEDHWACDHRARMVAEGLQYACEYRMVAADGRAVWIRESAAPILNGSDEPVLVRGVFRDVTTQRRAAEELERANAKLVDSSRHAGMAEVATGVLHNVGNVLNSVNISGSVISERLRGSKVIELGKVAGLLTLQKADFVGFVARDPRGPHIPEMISCLTDALRAEHRDLLEEIEAITRNICHIKEIVSMQQGFAKGAGLVEPLVVQTVVDDAIKINAVHLTHHRISVVQAFEEVPEVLADKHLVLQILVNLLRNAQQAIEEAGRDERRIVVKIQSSADCVKVAVKDSGNGIPAENLTRIFSHGYTTKKTGHGFGLHSGALAAAKMGGTLSAHSDGPGTGATFILELPIFKSAPAPA